MIQSIRKPFLAVLLAGTILAAGCGGKQAAEEKKAPPVAQIGIVNVQKVIQAHPRYAAYQDLQKQYNTLVAQAESLQQTTQQQAGPTGVSDSALQGINETLNQEFNTKMTAKQDEINSRLSQKAEQISRDLSAEFESYGKEVDQTYQHQIFSLQLKLKTVQLTKEETEQLQKQLETLQTERAGKLAAKEKELGDKMNAAMAAEKAAAGKELDAYAAQLNAGLEQQGAAKAAELASRMQQLPVKQVSPVQAELEQKMGMKQQEIMAMENTIMKDIADKAGKIAAARNLEAVLGQYLVNVTAVDITDDVIRELK